MTTASASDQTALERHASFFDPARSGRITCGQTYSGMKRLGVPFVIRVLLTPVINGFLGSMTQGHPSLVIRIATIAQGKHPPYESGAFGEAGVFDESAFDRLFAAAGDAITLDEMRAAITARGKALPQGNKIIAGLGHWFSSREVGVFFLVAADTRKAVNGKEVAAVKRATLRAFYDGTLFYEIAQRRDA